jgi:hypothetical protein
VSGDAADRKAVARPSAAGYSGTPLPAKLGLKPGHRLLAVNPPAHLAELLAEAPANITRLPRLAAFDVALFFVAERAALERGLLRLLPRLADAGMIWVAWPKKSSGVATEIAEDDVRGAGLTTGLVDVKICAIDATWSGLKFVRRLADRAAKRASRR